MLKQCFQTLWDPLSELLAESVAAPLNDNIVVYSFYLLFPVRESLPFSFVCALFS